MHHQTGLPASAAANTGHTQLPHRKHKLHRLDRSSGQTFAHDFFLGVGLFVQDAQLIVAVYEHDACVVALLHSTLILLSDPHSMSAEVPTLHCKCNMHTVSHSVLEAP